MDMYVATTDTLTPDRVGGDAGPPCSKTASSKPAYVHQVPGRLRVELQHLKKNPAAIERARERLSRIAGIRSVQGNPVLGSLTIEYDPEMKAETLLRALKNHGVDLPDSGGIAAVGCTAGHTSGAPSWKDVAFAGMALHLACDLIVWSTAASALAWR